MNKTVFLFNKNQTVIRGICLQRFFSLENRLKSHLKSVHNLKLHNRLQSKQDVSNLKENIIVTDDLGSILSHSFRIMTTNFAMN